MKVAIVIPIVAVLVVVRVLVFRHRRGRGRHREGQTVESVGPRRSEDAGSGRRRRSNFLEGALGDVGLVAMREIRERIRGRIFQVGTVVILVVVAAAVVIPKLTSSNAVTVQNVGIVGGLAPAAQHAVHTSGLQNADTVKFVNESSLGAAKAALRTGKLDLAIVGSDEVLLEEPAGQKNASADPSLVQAVAQYLGVLKAFQTAGISATQANVLNQTKPVPVKALQPGSVKAVNASSVVGIVLLFVMLTQYCTWILIGVMQEKSSRVVEVLLATLRPIQLLGGKVLGIGLVAMGQAMLVVGFALGLGAAVGSDLLRGAAPVALLSEFLWLVVGYSFYCWVYAAGGSTAERQDQVQTLALPLSIPMLIGYIYSVTVVSTGNPSLFFKVLAYLPPTAPFCMSVLVALGQVTWWEFTTSLAITVAATAGVAVLAARIYGRAVLRTGSRVRLRELVAGSAH